MPDVLIVLMYMWRLNSHGYWFKCRWAISQNYTRQLYTSMLCITFASLACCCCWCWSHKFWIGLHHGNTTLVDYFFSCRNFDCSVIHKWATNIGKVVIGGVTILQTWREHLPENGTWILIGYLWERNVVWLLGAVCGEERCVTKLKMAV